MSGTHVYYNGVLLRECETLEFDQVVEMDDSQTHERFMKTRITVASTLISIFRKGESTPLSVSQQHRSTIRIPSISDETMVGRAEEIMQLLSEPRKDFWYAVNGVADPLGNPNMVAPSAPPKEDRTDSSSYRLILVATGILPTVTGSVYSNEYVQLLDQSLTVKRVNVLDANNGPKPSGIDIQKVYGGNVLRVQATFEICRVLSKPVTDDNVDPGYDAQQVRGVISNTWSVVDGLDDDGAVTHTVSGRLCVKDQRYKANAMRMFAFPLAFPYARLTNRQHIVDETGLVLQYNYQFKHAGAAPPAGIRKYEATYGEKIRAGSSPVQTAFMNVKVMGWHDRSVLDAAGGEVPVLNRERVQKFMLLRGLYTILWSRIRGINKLWDPLPGHKPNTVNLVRAMVLERIGLPQLELRVEVKYTAQEDSEFHNRLINMGLPIDIADYDPRWWPVDNEWGRLPNGNGTVGNQGDKDNPYFTMPAYPYAESGDPTKSDYFTGYFRSPASNRHTLPRITGVTKNDFPDTSMEWARPGGSVPTDASAAPSSSTRPDSMNPIAGPLFSAIVSKNLLGEDISGPRAPVLKNNSAYPTSEYSGVSNLQKGGYMYLQWESEVKSNANEGKIMLPLSKPRTLTSAQAAALSVSGGVESSIAVRLSAAQSDRVYSVTATRFGKWPQIPEPAKQIVRKTGSILNCVETLLSKEILTETPELTANQTDREFTLHARYRYGMSNPWAGDSTEGGNDFEILPVGVDPTQKATAANNAITIRGSVSTDSPLFRSDAQYG